VEGVVVPPPDPDPLPEPEPEPPEEELFLKPHPVQVLPEKVWEAVSVLLAPQAQDRVRLCWLSEIDVQDP
jgi:hypothetical protein